MDHGEYACELRHHELDYRRALHCHDADHFARAYDLLTHEHCEATMGHGICGHDAGEPTADAIDGFPHLYGLWLADVKPDCSTLPCSG